VNGARGVIINVTGGPDMTLMEVNDASCIIQEAAHEDANIIFGAVVDPTLTGRTKITVIATGYEAKMSPRRSAAVQTPTDLARYAVASRPEAVAAAAGGGSPVVIARRAAVEVAGRTPAPMPSMPQDGAEPHAAQSPSAFDIPAFMRRPN
jgi:cell division protein FtsZ